MEVGGSRQDWQTVPPDIDFIRTRTTCIIIHIRLVAHVHQIRLMIMSMHIMGQRDTIVNRIFTNGI